LLLEKGDWLRLSLDAARQETFRKNALSENRYFSGNYFKTTQK